MPDMPVQPRRIVLILPCCIGDVVLATAVLEALRRAYPDAHITWAVGTWSANAIERHPALNATLDTGPAALPVKSPRGFLRFVQQLRAGRFDLAVSLVRSPLMSLAMLVSNIPIRAGLDSGGRGFGYTLRAPINPNDERHEAEIYLDVTRALGIDTTGHHAHIPPHPDDLKAASTALDSAGIRPPFVLVNPAGGSNPGMSLDAKRYPPDSLAHVIRGLQAHGLTVALTAGPKDAPIIAQLQASLAPAAPLTAIIGTLNLRQIGALASLSQLYIGNDTGLTHLAAASGAKAVMLMGPSSPRRYAPFTPDSLALWKPADISQRGVVDGAPADWDWARDGITPQDALARILDFLRQ